MGLLSRFEVTPGRHRPRIVRNGVVFLALFFGLLLFAFTGGSVPFWPKGGEVVKAEFATSANVQPGKTPVRVRGVNVGDVEKVERRPGGRGVIVTMRIKDDGVKLMRDARADILWRTLLGFGFYIQLEPGGAAEDLAEGDTIPLERTTAQVELDQVLSSVDAPSREGLQTTFREFDKGFGDGPAGRSLDALGPSMRQVAPGLKALRGVRQGDLTQTIRDASRVMGALAKSEDQLGQVITSADQALAVSAAKRAEISSILANGPATLDDTTRTMARLRTTLDELDPVAQDLRPGARKLDDTGRAVRPALNALRPVLDDARPLLRDLRPAVRRLGSASTSGVPLMDALDPTLARLSDTFIPKLNERGLSKLKGYEAIGPTFATVNAAAQIFDRNGHIHAFQPLAGGERSLRFLPCSTDLFKGDVKCEDVQQVFAGLFGGGDPPPARSSGAATRADMTPTPSSSSGTSASPATPTGAAVRRVTRVVRATVDALGKAF